MAEEPGKCRYIMGILEKNKKSKGTAFVYDENNDYYKMVDSLTSEEVQQMAQTLLKQNHRIEVTMLSE